MLIEFSVYLCFVVVKISIIKDKPSFLPVLHTASQFSKVSCLSLIFLQIVHSRTQQIKAMLISG